MTSASLNGLRTGLAQSDASDERMDQVRELLLGDFIRQFDAKISALEAKVEALSMRMEALSGEVTGDRRAAFDELSKGVAELSNQIGRISKV